MNRWASFVVFVLVLIRLGHGDLKANPPVADPTKWERFKAVALRRGRVWAQMVALAALAIGFGYWGYIRVPERDQSVALDQIVVEFPGTLRDPNGTPYGPPEDKRLQASRVIWAEAPSGTTMPDSSVVGQQFSLPQVVPNGRTRVAMGVIYYPTLAREVEVLVRLNLPEGVTLAECDTIPDLECKPNRIERDPKDLVRSDNLVEISGRLQPGDSAIGLAMDLEGTTDGLTFSRQRAHADVRPPYMVLTGPDIPNISTAGPVSQLPMNPVEVTNVVATSDGEDFSWTGPGPTLVTPEALAWDYEISQSTFFPPPPSSGVRQSAIENDAANLFYAGLLLGIAGGAFVALVQFALAEAFRRQPSDTP